MFTVLENQMSQLNLWFLFLFYGDPKATTLVTPPQIWPYQDDMDIHNIYYTAPFFLVHHL
jgi:hypothetical protein